jgi:phosphate starvation-inducible PhoH-like protein
VIASECRHLAPGSSLETPWVVESRTRFSNLLTAERASTPARAEAREKPGLSHTVSDAPPGSRPKTSRLELTAEAVRAIVGQLDSHLRVIEGAFGVSVGARDDALEVSGEPAAVDACIRLLDELAELHQTGFRLGSREIATACRLAREAPGVSLAEQFEKGTVGGRGHKQVLPRTARQREYVEAIRDHDVVFAIGPAGTGKTYLAVAMAVQALAASQVRRLILCRPAVEAGERLGFLPGDLVQKIDPYLRPLYDALYDLWDAEKVRRLIDRGVVEIAPLAFMRGRTLNDSFIIVDEAQNTTPEQMKMLLTRIGEGSKAIVNGDITQIDLPAGRVSGLIHARGVVGGTRGIGMVEFDNRDVVRHELVQRIVDAYERHESSSAAAPPAADKEGSRS